MISRICAAVAATIAASAMLAAVPPAAAEHTNVIVITGYWPPTNEGVRPFSTNPELNPDGWIGDNWENRGFQIHSFFPTFEDPDCSFCGRGMGDFEVDYQDTSGDFWPIMNGLQPVAIVTFSRGSNNLEWEVEAFEPNRDSWVNDYLSPFQPTPSPPDDSVDPWFERFSSLPMQAIVDAVLASELGLDAFIDDSQSAGSFLSGYMAYHGMWYKAIHELETDPTQCVAAGHIHVGQQVDWDTSHEAVKVTLRVVTEHVASLISGGPGDLDLDGTINVFDLLAMLDAWGPCPDPPDACRADLNGDGVVNVLDLLVLLDNWG
jgi:hypothetical protein